MTEYETYIFKNEPCWEKVKAGNINCYNWETESVYRPKSVFKLCLVENKGFFLKMKTDETDIRAVCKNRDENCWEDSCMEFFIKPFYERDEYLNFEMTAKGVYLCAIGKNKKERTFLKDITDIEPQISAKISPDGWSLEAFIPNELIEASFGQPFKCKSTVYKANFYKCGDKTKIPHFCSFAPMGELSAGFHDPDLFANIIVKEIES